MNLVISNLRSLLMFLFLGLVLLPALGILPPALAPDDLPGGKKSSLAFDILFAAVFVVAGLAVTAYALRRCPTRFVFADDLHVCYVFHTRVFPRDQIAATDTADRSTTLRSTGSIPLTSQDSVVSLNLKDGSKLAWGVSRETAARLGHALYLWNSQAGSNQGTPAS